jgi:hypothetical protein
METWAEAVKRVCDAVAEAEAERERVLRQLIHDGTKSWDRVDQMLRDAGLGGMPREEAVQRLLNERDSDAF